MYFNKLNKKIFNFQLQNFKAKSKNFRKKLKKIKGVSINVKAETLN